jgi:hypothetical protein
LLSAPSRTCIRAVSIVTRTSLSLDKIKDWKRNGTDSPLDEDTIAKTILIIQGREAHSGSTEVGATDQMPPEYQTNNTTKLPTVVVIKESIE